MTTGRFAFEALSVVNREAPNLLVRSSTSLFSPEMRLSGNEIVHIPLGRIAEAHSIEGDQRRVNSAHELSCRNRRVVHFIDRPYQRPLEIALVRTQKRRPPSPTAGALFRFGPGGRDEVKHRHRGRSFEIAKTAKTPAHEQVKYFRFLLELAIISQHLVVPVWPLP